MEFRPHLEPQEGADVIIGFDRVGTSFQIQGSAVPILKEPQCFSSELPILPLSKYLLQNPEKGIKNLNFPIFCDIFHPKITQLDNAPQKCQKCGSYIPPEYPQCCFCSNFEYQPTFYSFPNSEISQPLFLFLALGNPSDYFYDSLEHFPYPYILSSFGNEHFIVLHKSGKILTHLHLIDTEIPPSSIMKDVHQKLPHFPIVFSNKVNLNEILDKLIQMIQPLQSHVNIVIVNSQPHKCLSAFDNPNITISILSSNRINCECNACCYQTGGFFLPNSESISMEQLCEVYNSSIRYSNKFITIPEHSLLFPGYHLIFDQMPIVSSSPSTPIQIIIESNDRTFCFTTQFKSRIGLKSFLYETSLPNMLIALGEHREIFSEIVTQTLDQNSITVPYSLRYLVHFPSITQRRTIHSMLSFRPFAVQILPVMRVPDFISQSLFSNLSILLILYESTIYVYVGVDVTKDEWRNEIGYERPSDYTSFEILDVKSDFKSKLWTTIRSIRRMYEPYHLPVIVVPSESGKRVQLYELFEYDVVKGGNMIYKKFADMIRNGKSF